MSETRPTRPAFRALIVALAAFVMLGLVDGALGVAWPSMRATFDRGLSDLGLLLFFGSTGYLLASIGYGWLHSALGTGMLLGGGSVLMVVGIVGIAGAPAWGLVAVAAIVLGLGGGLVDTGMNAHAALVFDVGSINLLHACFGVGASLGPIVVTLSLVATGVWRAGYAALALLQVLVAMAVWTRRSRWAGEEPDLMGDAPVGGRRRQLWLHLILFFLYTGVEVGTGQWAFTLLSEGRGMETVAAGVWVAAYWGGLTAGRLGFGVVGNRLAPSRILGGSMLMSLLGLAILWLDLFGIGVVGLPIAGLGFAAVFPTLVSLTPAKIGRVRSTRSMGFQLAAANLGAAGVPWMLGILAEEGGLEALGPGLFVTALLLSGVNLVSDRAGKRLIA
ncbi:MAG: MFS transporter [Actinomycetota bacterium]